MKLNTQHIEEVRQYFLTTSEEDRLLIQNGIQSPELLKLLSSLKNAFDNDQDMEGLGIDEYLENIRQIKQGYLVGLATLYNSGKSTTDIETLIKNKNQSFLDEIDFQNDLYTAFVREERSGLKNKFNEADQETSLSIEEINQAFKLQERKKLKGQFQAIEKIAAPFSKPKATVIRFNWKKLAIAACLIGVVLATTFIILNKEDHRQDLASHSGDSIKALAENKKRYEREVYLNELHSRTVIPVKQIKNIITEPSLGFAPINKKITIQVYDFKQILSEIKTAISNSVSTRGIDSSLNSLKLEYDSLNNLIGKYMLNKDSLSLYVISEKDVKVCNLGIAYYVNDSNTVYEIKKTTTPLPLKNITDKNIINRIQNMSRY